MKVKHETNIDTVAVQLDFDTPLEQRNKFNLIYNWIIGRGLGKLEYDEVKSNHRINVYNLMSGRSKLATLQTGFSKKFYIRIRWCGLKSFKLKQDEASLNNLIAITALLNTSRSNYRFVELDVSLDLFCPFNKILATCIRPVNNVHYNPIGFLQYFKGVPTTYIEDYKYKEKRVAAMKRSYLYDKANKENLDYWVTRFEVKLQNRFFLKYGFNLSSIAIALDKYAIFYFNRTEDKKFEIYNLGSKKSLKSLELLGLQQNYQRVHYDISVVEEFIRRVESVYVDFYGDVVVPAKTHKYFL